MSIEEDVLEQGRRIAELERKVAELSQRLGQGDADFGLTFASDQPSSPADDPQLAEMVAQGNMIGAIKRYRELTGAGLKEAKDAVEAISP